MREVRRASDQTKCQRPRIQQTGRDVRRHHNRSDLREPDLAATPSDEIVMHGMQKVRGSNPLSSTLGQRPVPISKAGLLMPVQQQSTATTAGHHAAATRDGTDLGRRNSPLHRDLSTDSACLDSELSALLPGAVILTCQPARSGTPNPTLGNLWMVRAVRPQGAGKIRTGEIRAAHGHAGEVRAAKVRAGEIRMGEIYGDVGRDAGYVGEIIAIENNSGGEVWVFKRPAGEARLYKDGQGEVRAAQGRAGEIGTVQDRAGKVRIGEVRTG